MLNGLADLQIYFVHAESPCSDLAQYNYTEYAFLGIDLICTGVGQGYFLNFPAPTVAPPITWVGADAALDPNAAGAYACNKFKYFGNQVGNEMNLWNLNSILQFFGFDITVGIMLPCLGWLG